MKLSLDLKLTPEQVAEAFCDLNDEEQAQVFIEIAAIASRWETGHGAAFQWWLVGKHLRTCSCSNDDARAVITEMADGISGAEAA